MIFLHVDNDRIEADIKHPIPETRIIATAEDWNDLVDFADEHETGFSASSTMDFPEDETFNKATIALAHRIRNGQ